MHIYPAWPSLFVSHSSFTPWYIASNRKCTYRGRYMCSGYTGGRKMTQLLSTVKSFIKHAEAHFLRTQITNILLTRMHLSRHISYSLNHSQYNQFNIRRSPDSPVSGLAGLRNPTPDSESGVSIPPPARRCSVPSPRTVLPSGKPLTGLQALPPHRQGYY